ncbi:hypothetical protein IW261DRAFT_1413028 [Armillaria novae-zelandiae]|uniref:Uncharacterized protein n=1 Tax=Armillaria novae-zelandiae TaxID=153914 RepID=A0AA39US49_9AGAR|nr:hypothetical protein IW261DRAFT_1413028 [Armillaria novae-zelandiae]
MPPIRTRDRLFPSMHSVRRQADALSPSETIYYQYIPLPSFVFRYEPYGHAYFNRNHPLMSLVSRRFVGERLFSKLGWFQPTREEVALDRAFQEPVPPHDWVGRLSVTVILCYKSFHHQADSLLYLTLHLSSPIIFNIPKARLAPCIWRTFICISNRKYNQFGKFGAFYDALDIRKPTTSTCSFLLSTCKPQFDEAKLQSTASTVDKPTNERCPLLRIPVAIIAASVRRGRKWLLYVATAVARTSGHLYQDGRDLKTDEPVVDNEAYDFVVGGALYITDAQCSDTRAFVNLEESWHHNRDMITGRDGGRRVILEPGIAECLDGFAHQGRAVRWNTCHGAHILPLINDIDDKSNAMCVNREIHAKWLSPQTSAFLYVPNAYSLSILNSSNSHQYPIDVAVDQLSSSSIENWLWRANGLAMEEDGVDDTETIIRKEFRSDKREVVERWCQEIVG